MDEKRVGDSDYRLAHELAHELERWELNADMFKQCCKRSWNVVIERGKRWQRCGVCLHFLHIASQELKIQIRWICSFLWKTYVPRYSPRVSSIPGSPCGSNFPFSAFLWTAVVFSWLCQAPDSRPSCILCSQTCVCWQFSYCSRCVKEIRRLIGEKRTSCWCR